MTVTVQRTNASTPCLSCGKAIKGKRYYPGYCNGRCLAAHAIDDLQRRADAGQPLFDNMTCACCGGELRVYADPARLRDPEASNTWYDALSVCDLCSFRRCPKGDQCSARRAA